MRRGGANRAIGSLLQSRSIIGPDKVQNHEIASHTPCSILEDLNNFTSGAVVLEVGIALIGDVHPHAITEGEPRQEKWRRPMPYRAVGDAVLQGQNR